MPSIMLVVIGMCYTEVKESQDSMPHSQHMRDEHLPFTWACNVIIESTRALFVI
jgi:hypothetical protein